MITKQIVSDFRKSHDSFFYSSKESNHEYIPIIYTKNFTAFFEKSVYPKQYIVNIFYSAPRLTIFKTLNISGYLLDIKRFVYGYMLKHEDNRIQR